MKKLSLFMLMAVGLLISGNVGAQTIEDALRTNRLKGDEVYVTMNGVNYYFATLEEAVSAAEYGFANQLLDGIDQSNPIIIDFLPTYNQYPQAWITSCVDMPDLEQRTNVDNQLIAEAQYLAQLSSEFAENPLNFMQLYTFHAFNPYKVNTLDGENYFSDEEMSEGVKLTEDFDLLKKDFIVNLCKEENLNKYLDLTSCNMEQYRIRMPEIMGQAINYFCWQADYEVAGDQVLNWENIYLIGRYKVETENLSADFKWQKCKIGENVGYELEAGKSVRLLYQAMNLGSWFGAFNYLSMLMGLRQFHCGVVNVNPEANAGKTLFVDLMMYHPEFDEGYPIKIRISRTNYTFPKKTPENVEDYNHTPTGGEVGEDGYENIVWEINEDWKTNSQSQEVDKIPTENSNVVIGASQRITITGKKDGDAEKANVADYAYKITIPENGQLLVGSEGALVVGGGEIVELGNKNETQVVIKSDDKGTGMILFEPLPDNEQGQMQNEVIATVELHTNAHQIDDNLYYWNYIGIPLACDNTNPFTATMWEKIPNQEGEGTATYFDMWNTDAGWEAITELKQLVPFTGYAITNTSKNGVTYKFKGRLVGSCNSTMDFTKKGFNFFANSFTAPISVLDLLGQFTAEGNKNLAASIYMFKEEGKAIVGVSAQDAIYLYDGDEDKLPFKVVPIMNGFFMWNMDEHVQSATIDYEKSVYEYNISHIENPESPHIFAAPKQEQDFSRVGITISSENGEKDYIYLIEADNFSEDFENGYDEVKYMNANHSNLYSKTNHGLQSKLYDRSLDGIMLGFQANNQETNYTLSFNNLKGNTYQLTDLMTGSVMTISEGETYDFQAQAGSTLDQRFVINRAPESTTNSKQVKTAKVPGVYTIMGQYMGTMKDFNKLASGVYVVEGNKIVK